VEERRENTGREKRENGREERRRERRKLLLPFTY
jgi:hypothetical protein